MYFNFLIDSFKLSLFNLFYLNIKYNSMKLSQCENDAQSTDITNLVKKWLYKK